jgi:hypothetical protein
MTRRAAVTVTTTPGSGTSTTKTIKTLKSPMKSSQVMSDEYSLKIRGWGRRRVPGVFAKKFKGRYLFKKIKML